MTTTRFRNKFRSDYGMSLNKATLENDASSNFLSRQTSTGRMLANLRKTTIV